MIIARKHDSIVDRLMNPTSQNKMKRSARILLLLVPAVVFCVSSSFGLAHHFYHYSWAGDIFYYSAVLFVVVILVELFLMTLTK
jgi:protein-S-isoprenylcysteine O-methyltransferase Ste14